MFSLSMITFTHNWIVVSCCFPGQLWTCVHVQFVYDLPQPKKPHCTWPDDEIVLPGMLLIFALGWWGIFLVYNSLLRYNSKKKLIQPCILLLLVLINNVTPNRLQGRWINGRLMERSMRSSLSALSKTLSMLLRVCEELYFNLYPLMKL